MKISKFGHSCLLVEDVDKKILIDPGNLSSGLDNIKELDLILITHGHQDHLDVELLKKILSNNPQVKIIAGLGAIEIMEKEGINFIKLEDGENYSADNILIEAIGNKHLPVSNNFPEWKNTGFFINNKFFYPGDALTKPNKTVEILALPVSGPFVKLAEAIDYALEIKPKVCIPVHEGLLKTPGSSHKIPQEVLEKEGIKFAILDNGNILEY